MIANLFGSKERSDRTGVMEVQKSVAGVEWASDTRIDKGCDDGMIEDA